MSGTAGNHKFQKLARGAWRPGSSRVPTKERNCMPENSMRGTFRLSILLLFGILDLYIIRYPIGILPLHRLIGSNKYQANTSCGWDYEGNWSVRLKFGTSPLTLRTTKPTMSKPLTCLNTGVHPPSSFVADPFLVLEDHRILAFFELKALSKFTPPAQGQIGVAELAVSRADLEAGVINSDWNYLGVALRETFHLSYPFVFTPDLFCSAAHPIHLPAALVDLRLMLPETSKSPIDGLHFYQSSGVDFPMKWTRVPTVWALESISGMYNTLVDVSMFRYRCFETQVTPHTHTNTNTQQPHPHRRTHPLHIYISISRMPTNEAFRLFGL